MVRSSYLGAVIAVAFTGLSIANVLPSQDGVTSPMNSLSKRGDGPEYHDMDDDAEGECAASWEDMLKIVAEHGVKADYDGATFTRWFGNTGAPSGLLGTIQRSDHKRKIKNVYQNMVKDDGEAKDVWEDIKVQGKDYAKMDDGNTNAYTSPSKGTMHFTKQFYDFDHSDDANCNEVGNIVSWKMQLQEGIWIHEATHYNKIGKAAIGDELDDFSDGTAYSAMQLASNDPDKAMKNSDNYMWFVLENFWAKKCNRQFGPPVQEAQQHSHGKVDKDD